MDEPRLTHLDQHGAARMVDVADKPPTRRSAVARARLRMAPATLAAALAGDAPKGDVAAAARIAGIMAAKRTAELIPLCHPLPLTTVRVDFRPVERDGRAWLEIEARAETVGPTGVEMEALTAAAVAALTVYDMCKGLERGMVIEEIRLLEKRGGRSGTWRAADATPDAPPDAGPEISPDAADAAPHITPPRAGEEDQP